MSCRGQTLRWLRSPRRGLKPAADPSRPHGSVLHGFPRKWPLSAPMPGEGAVCWVLMGTPALVCPWSAVSRAKARRPP